MSPSHSELKARLDALSETYASDDEWIAFGRAAIAQLERAERYAAHLPTCRIIEGRNWPIKPQCSCGLAGSGSAGDMK